MQIELTIQTSYLPEWGMWEGVREIIQNAKDADAEGYPMSVGRARGILRVANKGAKLPHQALLLGHTTKHGRMNQIGQFGEGLKLGVLALVRAGHEVKIRSGQEIWTPRMVESEKFEGAEVLAFSIRRGREEDGVAVEIGGIQLPEWEEMYTRFLFLSDCHKVETLSGSVLLEPSYQGRVYVKGIHVQDEPRLSYGYDLPDADIDRDRKMVSSWDMEWRLINIWGAALDKEESMAPHLWPMLQADSYDLAGLKDEWSVSKLPKSVREDIARMFFDEYGKDALPVSDMAQSKEIGHLGKRGIVVPKQLAAVVLNGKKFDEVKREVNTEVSARHSWPDLTDGEKLNLESAIDILGWSGVESVELSDIEVVSFRSYSLLGLFKDDKIVLGRHILPDRRLTLKVLVHEVAHRAGGDGDKFHISRVEDIWAGIVESLR